MITSRVPRDSRSKASSSQGIGGYIFVVFKVDNAGVRQVTQVSIRVKLGNSRLVYNDILLGYEAMYFDIMYQHCIAMCIVYPKCK
jgi:hypothetical protein